MMIYKRGGQFLVVFGDIPQWLIVDAVGLGVLKKIGAGQNADQVAEAYRLDERSNILATFEELVALVTRTNEGTSVGNQALTSKTTVAMVAVTRRCNLQSICPHCYIDAGQSQDDLSLEEHRLLAKQLRLCLAIDSQKIYKINLTGGEPFMRHDILGIIRVYNQAGFAVNMSTNAMLIKPKQMIALRELGVTVSVSL